MRSIESEIIIVIRSIIENYRDLQQNSSFRKVMFCKKIVENSEQIEAHTKMTILVISFYLVKKQLEKNSPSIINLR
jgi:hypothetical protein